MNRPFIYSVLVMAFASNFSQGKSIECWANGNRLRQTSGGGDHVVSSRVYLVLEKVEESATITLSRYHGHLAISDGSQSTMDQASAYYGVFLGEMKPFSLSPRARRYKDADYFRIRDFSADGMTRSDGGDMSGEFVLSKKFLENDEEFDAHYIFQAGDHMGGTVDYDCGLTW